MVLFAAGHLQTIIRWRDVLERPEHRGSARGIIAASCSADIPPGWWVRWRRADADEHRDSAEHAPLVHDHQLWIPGVLGPAHGGPTRMDVPDQGTAVSDLCGAVRYHQLRGHRA